jgi:acetolactate synthase-1/2/3 large subunit
MSAKARTVAVDEGAEAFLELLNANRVDYIFLNPGSDTFPVQEAVSKFRALGKHVPEVVLCLDESVGMNAAYGYFMVTKRPQVVLVHTDVGMQQAGAALHSAQRGRVGIVFCAGRTPLFPEGDKRQARSHFVNWAQEQFDQAGIVRGYVKWEYELRSNQNLHRVIPRAFQVASTEPCGPVYLTLPRELLMEKLESIQIPNSSRHTAPFSPQADADVLAQIAEILIQAKNPIIITGYSGRNTESVAALVELAETIGARVITDKFRMNFPTNHPLCGGINPHPYLADADVILIIDHDAPYLPAQAKPGPDAKIIHIDIDPIKQAIPTWSFPVDILVQADSSKAIPALTKIIQEIITPEQRSRAQARFQQLKSEYQKLQAEWHNLAISKAEQKPISAEWLAHCIAEVVDKDTIILNESISNSPSVAHQIPRSMPGTTFNSGGSSLGWGLGGALGAKLAAPDKTVVTLEGDGSFMYGRPIETFWAAHVYHAPFLCIIFNNERYHSPKKHLREGYGKDSFSERTGVWVGIDIVPPPNYALVAQASHAYGQRVEDPSALTAALQQALDQVHGGKCAVLDVKIE